MRKKIWEDERTIGYQEGKIQYLQFKKLLEFPEIVHCYTLKSEGELNFLPEYKDKKILENSKRNICHCLGLDNNKFIKPHQTHTDIIEVVNGSTQTFSEVDGLITNKRGVTLCTTSADCTSLLFYDPVNQVIGDVHSGWRGTLQRIGPKAINKMQEEYNSNPENIICCICPHIRKCHFEVEKDVVELFKKEFADMKEIERMIEVGRKVENVQKYYINTTQINIQMLKKVGLQEKNIIDSARCTVCEQDRFHSYRVNQEISGRNGAIITLKDN